MKHASLLLLVSYMSWWTFVHGETSQRDQYYTAAAVQFTPSGTYTDPPWLVIQQSVDRFDSFSESASAQGANLVIFPEGATGMFFAEVQNTREAMLPYCTQVGEVNQFAPCQGTQPPVEATEYQLFKAACTAKNFSLILAFNLCETQTCSNATDPNCPQDGRYQWNTELVFNETGVLVAKYHKAHLFGGSAVFDQATPVPTSFTSSFGVTFGTFICFDLLYQHPPVDLVQQGITDFIFSSYWVNSAPTFNAIMQQQAWSRLHGVNLIASNVGAFGANSGGGIYSAGEALQTYFDGDSIGVNRMLVAKLPILKRKIHSTPAIASHMHRRPYLTPIAKNDAHAVANKLARLRSHELTGFAYTPCAPNSVFAGAANCTFFTSASLFEAAIGQGFDVSQPADFNIPISMGNVACSFTLSFASMNSTEVYVAFAYEGVQTFPDTPDPLSLQACAVHHCVASGQPGTCLGSWEPYESTIELFSITATGVDPAASAFPEVGVDDGQVLVDVKDTQFTDGTAIIGGVPVRVLQWSSTASFGTQSLYSAAFWAVRPNNSSQQHK